MYQALLERIGFELDISVTYLKIWRSQLKGRERWA